MNFSSELLFFFSALGAFNGIVLSVYILITAGRKHISNIFLAIALLMLSIRAGKSVFFHFDDNLVQVFIQIGIIACYLIGPFIYFYMATICSKDYSLPKWKWHLFVLVPIILFLTFRFPYYEYRDYWAFQWLRLIYIQWLIYLVMSWVVFYRWFKKHQGQHNQSAKRRWVLNVLITFSLVWLAYFTTRYTSYIVGAVTFTVIGYLLLLFILNTRKRGSFLLQNTLQKSDLEKSEALLQEVSSLFQSNKIYKQPSIKCGDVAKLLNVPAYLLSQAVNETTGENFNQYVNVFRIEEAKKLLQSNSKLTIEAIGQECGFKSKSSFYSAFKKITGTTPSKFV